ncbi:hypothetical protein I4U23_012309 [Adineta vaga]|nr:hypothetical protein I4U23_012309 [Adineta vaga]
MHRTQSRLRGIIDYLEIYNQLDACETAIRNCAGGNIFLIVNASMCLKFLTLFHDSRAIHSIYTYECNECIDQSILDQFKTYKQFEGIYDQPNEVFIHLSKAVRIHSRHLFEENNNLLLSTPEKLQRTTGLHSRVELMNWFTYLFDVIEEVPGSHKSKEKFVQECRTRYCNTPSILRAVEEFNTTYEPQKAIWWYTREGFLFRFLNRALRQQDQNDILLLHFYIHDLTQQLKIEFDKNHDADWTDEHVYRGQLMSMNEIKFIEKRQLHTLYANTFLSTSTDLDIVQMFAGIGCNDLDAPLQSVIIDITGNSMEYPSEKSVADIHHLSYTNDEKEILFSAAYTFVTDSVTYDESDKVWKIHLNRIADAYDLKVEVDQRLIKLDVLIRIILDDADSSMDLSEDEKSTSILCATNISLLLQELSGYDSTHITLNTRANTEQVGEHNPPYELTALRTFVECSVNRQYTISSLTLMTSHDCLGNIYKEKGKYELAFEHFNKANAYSDDTVNKRIAFTRKVNLAQTHKLAGQFAEAYLIYDELENDELTESYRYERLLSDIALDRSYHSTISLFDQLHNCFNYLEFIRPQIDLEADNFTIAEAYIELGQLFLFRWNNSEMAKLCFTRDIEVSRISDPDESIIFGPKYERLTDAYALDDVKKALENYQAAIDQYSRLGEMSHLDLALCWCKSGCLHNEHQIEPFEKALPLILSLNEQKILPNIDEIASCLLHLAKSSARCQSLNEMTLELCQSIIRLYPHELNSDQGLNNDFQDLIELIIKLHEKMSKQDNSVVPTEDDILHTWKSLPSMNSKEIIQLLESVQQKLRNSVATDS